MEKQIDNIPVTSFVVSLALSCEIRIIFKKKNDREFEFKIHLSALLVVR